MVEKFGRRAAGSRTRTRTASTSPDFQVESYLRYQADAFAKRFDANAYLYISRALTYFDLARTYGGGSLERALANVRARSLLLSFSSDWLYGPRYSEEIVSALCQRCGGAARHDRCARMATTRSCSRRHA
jgi:homoserine O-acetyltransferase